jgi:hypothetical protein
VRVVLLLAFVLIVTGCRERSAPQSHLVLWAWERPEDLRFAPDTEIAIQSGFILLSGDRLHARGRYFPLKSARAPATVLVHVQIDHAQPLRWTPKLRAQLGAAVRHYATVIRAPRVQLDFEVRQSERPILLETLADLRRALPATTQLSMTALTSWCMSENWLAAAPVDEIVPMLFRMQDDGPAILKTLAAGGDFRNPRCRTALAVSSDSPIPRAPRGRRVYLFSPKSWTAESFDKARQAVEGWQ